MVRLAPWQVWWVDFNPQVGTEQAGTRPGIIVGSEYACARPNGLVLLVPCTSTDRRLAWHPPVTLAGRHGFAMCDQIKTVSIKRLTSRHSAGVLDVSQRAQIAFVLSRFIVQS